MKNLFTTLALLGLAAISAVPNSPIKLDGSNSLNSSKSCDNPLCGCKSCEGDGCKCGPDHIAGARKMVPVSIPESEPALVEETRPALTNVQIIEIYAEHEAEISKIWLSLGEDGTLKDAVLKWLDQQKAIADHRPTITPAEAQQVAQFTQPTPQPKPVAKPAPKPVVKAAPAGHWQTYQSCGRGGCSTYQVWVPAPAGKPVQPAYQAPVQYGSCGPGGCGRVGLFGRRR